LFIAFVSYLFTGKADHSVVEGLAQGGLLESALETENWLGLYGAMASHYFIFRWFGVSGFLVPFVLFLLGFKLAFKRSLLPISSSLIVSVFTGLWLCLLFGYLTLNVDGVIEWSFLGGGLGYQTAMISHGLLGWGTFLLLVLSLFLFIIFFFNVTSIPAFLPADPKPMGNDAILKEEAAPAYTDDQDNWPKQVEKDEEEIPESVVLVKPQEPVVPVKEVKLEVDKADTVKREKDKAEPDFIIEERTETDEVAEKLVEDKGVYDPTLDLSKYK